MNQEPMGLNWASIKTAGIIAWGYLVEAFAGIAITAILFGLLESEDISDGLEKAASEWSQLTTAFLGSAVAAWFTFVNLRPSEFGDYLESLGAIKVYSNAFLASVYVHMAATIFILITKSFPNKWLLALTTFIITYSIINFITLLRNAATLIELYATFRRTSNKL